MADNRTGLPQDNIFEIEPASVDDSVVRLFTQQIYALLKDDWVTLSKDPELVAEQVARYIVPVAMGSYGNEISGSPWSAR